jgi:hypothetical protein
LNLKYLGDALDHWKGSLFDDLQRSGILNSFAVDLMTTDSPEWTDSDIKIFSRLLRITPSQVIRHASKCGRPLLETLRVG